MNKIIAIDGPTASGKGTLAKKLAKHFNLPYLNTGGLYRSVALYMVKNNLDYNDKNVVLRNLENINFSDLDNPELYVEEIGSVAGKIAAIDEVREFLLKFQQDFAQQEEGAILDGRDIGTVICPEASYKFYITASVEERARRRYEEMKNLKKNVDYKEILFKLQERDKRDIERANSPLKKAEDAVEIDTTHLSIEEALEKVLSFINIKN